MFRIAKKVAGRSDHKNFRHGVVVLRGGKIIATGTNRSFEHAEVNALKKLAPEKRRGARLISIRVTKTGKLAMAKPCAECELYLRQNGVKMVLWTDSESQVHREKL